MGSYEYDTQQTNPAGKNNNAATDVADTEEVKKLKTQYKNELNTLQELFEEWTEADLLFALQEASGDLETAVTRISQGHTAQWGEVKSRKSKKEHNNKAKVSGQQSGSSRGHQRGGHSDRGRPRGEGGFRGGRSNDRARGPRKENGSGYTRPPRQQNGPNSNHDDTNNGVHAKLGTKNASGNWGNNENAGGDLNCNSNESWSDSKGPAWGSDNNTTNDWSTDNPTHGWTNDNAADNSNVSLENDTSTDKGQNSRTNDVPTENSQVVWNGNDNINNSGGWTTENTENTKDSWVSENPMDNLGVNRESDKSTDNSKHGREPNIVKDNNNTQDTDTSKDNWGVGNSRTSDTSKENWGSEASKNGKNIRDAQKSPNPGAPRSITAVKSPVPHKSRTIPSQPKASWAQIVKPEVKPDLKPEPVSTSIHKNSPEIVKSVSPQISKSPSIPVHSSPTPKMTEPISVPSPETVAPVIAVVKTEEVKESIKEVPSPEQSSSTPVASSPVVDASPRAKEISPPGLLYKSKTGAPMRRLKQDAAVVMPSAGAGLERVGVQFGSLSISNVSEETVEIEAPVSPPVQDVEETPQHPQSQATPVQQQQLQQTSSQQQTVQSQTTQQMQQTTTQQQQLQQAAQQQFQQQLQQQVTQPSSSSLPQTNSINRSIPTSSTQSSALQSSSSVPPSTPLTTAPTPTQQNFNPSYFKQQQEQPTSAAYLNQQHHIGLAAEPLNAPYGSYLHSQPPNQMSGFGIGPMQSLPDYGAAAALYGPDAQRVMGYYADPSYGQASQVTSTGYQNRDNNKYTPDTPSNSGQNSTQLANTQQQSANQQQGQNPQQPYPVYYPYYYLPSYQQSGYGQPFVNKSIYPMYNPHSTKPGSASGATPYGYPTTPTTPNTPHHYSHTSTTGYDDITAGQIHHLPGVPNVHEYKAYGGAGGMPPLNFLGNTAGNTPQPASGTTGSTTSGGKAGNNGSSELNSPAQYKGYGDKTSTAAQQAGVGQSGVQQHQQQQQPSNPSYYGQQQAQQMFNSYQYPQTHHQYHPHQAHHQVTGRNQHWSNQS